MAVQLTKQQHVVPSESISRFCDINGLVWVKRRATGHSFQANRNNKIFRAKRAWEERSETGHKKIEDAYQSIADEICTGGITSLNQTQSDAVTAMFALWVARSSLIAKPLLGLSGEASPGIGFPTHRNVSGWHCADRDRLEKAGLVVSDPDGSIPGRMLAWPYIQRQIAVISAKLREARWGILQAEEGDFLLPDHSGPICYLPVSPKKALAVGQESRLLSRASVEYINLFAASDYQEWVVSRARL